MEVMVEGYQQARGQVVGRSSQNKTVNFTVGQPILPAMGSYVQVRVTQTFPNSLAGEAIVTEPTHRDEAAMNGAQSFGARIEVA
jgi:tRNA-2-methylthio-N6-dimethylallyladenosine synthase